MIAVSIAQMIKASQYFQNVWTGIALDNTLNCFSFYICILCHIISLPSPLFEYILLSTSEIFISQISGLSGDPSEMAYESWYRDDLWNEWWTETDNSLDETFKYVLMNQVQWPGSIFMHIKDSEWFINIIIMYISIRTCGLASNDFINITVGSCRWIMPTVLWLLLFRLDHDEKIEASFAKTRDVFSESVIWWITYLMFY